MTSQAEAIGAQVRAARMRRGLTNEGLAALAGVSQGTVTKIERGDDVRPGNLQKVVTALGVTPVTLEGFTEDIAMVLRVVGAHLTALDPGARALALERLGRLMVPDAE